MQLKFFHRNCVMAVRKFEKLKVYVLILFAYFENLMFLIVKYYNLI